MDAATIIWAILLVLVVYFFKYRSNDRIARHVNKIPGPISLPFVGTTWAVLFIPWKDFFRLSKSQVGKYGKVFRTWLGSKPEVHFLAPEYVERILNNSVQINKSFIYDSLRPWLGEGLLTTTGERWHQHRKLITPTFHFKILDSFVEVFNEKAQLLTQQLQSRAGGEVFNMFPLITNCALDIICETAMGVQMNAMSGENNEYLQAVHGINCAQVIAEKKASYQKVLEQNHAEDDELGRKKRRALLDLLIDAAESGAQLTDTDIREEVDTFMFAGHDTTTAGICWSLFLLGNNPEIQEEVYQEIESVFQARDKPLTVNDLGELKLLERCIKEALRLYPSVPVIARMLSEDVKIDNYTIPAGCTVNILIFLLHRDEGHFPEPETFNPDRFLPENVVNRHPYAYIPFSAGPRNCIGQKFAMYEEKTLLAHILRKFKVRAIENQETVHPIMDLVLRPLNGLRVVLEPRDHKSKF